MKGRRGHGPSDASPGFFDSLSSLVCRFHAAGKAAFFLSFYLSIFR